ncbi:MAG: glycoside hydrolase family 2 TIM barrel-domain containing protein [Bacteroidota bacterium]|nr:glycoside hydrolase family 2 TIM barrel-domain containing protein [Bacteroidota bacterium]
MPVGISSQTIRTFSVAGFYELPNSGRHVYNFNVGWRFVRGNPVDAEALNFDDHQWPVVSLPHTVELMPCEASGCRNYQGPAWYRKHFTVDGHMQGKRLSLYVEAAMGRTQVYVNGKHVLEHLGGYLPFSIDLTKLGVKPGQVCLVAIKVDNSDDNSYPPGKPQNKLDFCYHGGIYRDTWLIATSDVHVSDPNAADKVAGGGVFAHVENLTETHATVVVKTDVQNDGQIAGKIKVMTVLRDPQGKPVKSATSTVLVASDASAQAVQTLTVKQPQVWSPEMPSLYTLETRLTDNKGHSLDGGITRIGLRKLEFKGKDGFYLNGKPYDKLIGANRHQDFAYVGNAVPNSQQWRDAKLLRDAGCRVIRTAHYPQDPSFMDACDELGLFVIVAIPGWQYFNKDPHFAELCYQDLRNTIRRDRNHACLMMWEPILNETQYPASFSLQTLAITREEYPYPGTFSAADGKSAGIKDNYDVVYGFPEDLNKYNQPMFTREWGEYVDDWFAHNAPNRVSRSWGEGPQVVQAMHLAMVYNDMCNTPRQFIGGALWHPFDHQRGYHPDPYWGGLLDAFRQPKYAYYLFKSQMDPKLVHPLAQTGPMVFVAHEMTPFSSPDVTVFTNCDSVRLIRYEQDTFIQKVERKLLGMPNPPVVFKGIFDNYQLRKLSYIQKKWQKASLLVEGIIDGQVVCTEKKMPSRRSSKLRLMLDHQGQALQADGSDFAVVVCEETDDEGNVRRLAKDNIVFTVEGEGSIIGDVSTGANPRAVEFGSAPVLIRSTIHPGTIIVNARVQFEGENAPAPARLTFESVPPVYPLLYQEKPWKSDFLSLSANRTFTPTLTDEQKQKALQEVEQQQTTFGKTF